MQLVLSKSLPLTLQIDLPFKQWNFIRPDIIKHRYRIETIVLSAYYSHGNLERNKDVRKILGDLGPLPSSRQLGGPDLPSSEVYDVPWIINHCHSLEQTVNILMTSQDLRVAKERLTFSELITHERPEHILPVAETIKELRKVIFLAGSLCLGPKDVETPNLQPLSTHPLGWTHPNYGRYDYMIPKSLLNRLPSLVVLEIGADFHTLLYIVSIADQFPSLCRFKAMTPLKTQDKITFPDNISPNRNIYHLELDISHQWSYYGLSHTGTPKLEQLCQSVHIVPEMMLHAMPNTKYLGLTIDGMLSEFPFSLSKTALPARRSSCAFPGVVSL
ncbi:hypothetical protein CPB86DRAFT_146986 [Serendipita vermifera]|nr:hypothetical protein CPB86DRAFT_146986 [Serendipita vermifera]